ncbi:hypothetical protein IV203_017975 [Nitzschia inconspicua]|uniref:Uncharacterized protein n=1 Tax=Nitzschia inconspicua TaxID=303405 RepID=A0A9K3Q5G7_9STRA|nr:hypothetical protein IV203_017975 [Nitzschia inconspicua]
MMVRRNSRVVSRLALCVLVALSTQMDSSDGLSPRTTHRRMRIPFPSFKIRTSIRPRGIRLRYTSSRSSEDSNDVFPFEGRAEESNAQSSIVAAMVTKTVTKQHRITMMTPTATDDGRIDAFPGFPANTSASTASALSPTATSAAAGHLSKAWKRIKAASHVDKEAIAKLGISFGLTYNLISNINGSISLSLAWYIASTKTGLSPLAPGQWKALLAAYGTLYVVLCFIRPFRIALALGATRKMDTFLEQLQTKFRCQRPAAIGIAALCSVVLWISLCALGVTLASTLAGVPFWRIAPGGV